MIVEFLDLLVFVFIVITGLLIVNLFVRKMVDIYIRLNFKKIETEIREYLDKAYNIVYAEDLSVYVASNMTLNFDDDEYLSLLKKLINTFKYLVGQKQYEYYESVFGGKDQFIDYINLYFTEAVYNDVIKHMMKQVANQQLK